jgi:hypothetical protein
MWKFNQFLLIFQNCIEHIITNANKSQAEMFDVDKIYG